MPMAGYEKRSVTMTCTPLTPERDATRTLITPVFLSSQPGSPIQLPKALPSPQSNLVLPRTFKGTVGELLTIHTQINNQPQLIVLLGLGSSLENCADHVREAAAELGREYSGCSSMDILTDDLLDEQGTLQAFVEGLLLGLWEKDRDIRSRTPDDGFSLGLIIGEPREISRVQRVFDRGYAIAEAVQLARDVSNAPASSLSPSAFEELASATASSSELRFSAFTQSEIEQARLSGLMAVAKGSSERPAFVTLEHKSPGAAGAPIILIGKGVTFDSGGLTLKPGTGLPRMKHDKAGAGVVLAVMGALAKLEAPRHVIALLPLVENMPGGTASRPGDVLSMANDRTVEIISTDAEGRLILADALLYARRFKPQFIVDIATLCGATRVALGREAAAIFSNSDSLREDLIEAGRIVDETLWPLPLMEGYLDDLRSPVADLRNSALAKGKGGGACVAAAFLNEFVSSDWAHIDIAGVAWDNGSKKYFPREGASGFGVRLLIEYLCAGS